MKATIGFEDRSDEDLLLLLNKGKTAQLPGRALVSICWLNRNHVLSAPAGSQEAGAFPGIHFWTDIEVAINEWVSTWIFQPTRQI
jgi:hypothetical protein